VIQNGNIYPKHIKTVNESFVKLKTNTILFTRALNNEWIETVKVLTLVNTSFLNNTKLSIVEKNQVSNQLKNMLKTMLLVMIFILPGGSAIFFLIYFFKISKYIIPNSFSYLKKDI
jgi:hypothetical protein